MYQAELVHHATVCRHRAGQEDITRRVLSSASSNAGISKVIREPQTDPVVFQVRTAGGWAWLSARLHFTAMALPVAARPWAPGGPSPAAS